MVTARTGTSLAHLRTWRPYTLWYIGLVGLAGAGLAGTGEWWRLFAAWAAPTVGWVGGHYLSDWFDRDLDAIAKPHRPIPSGMLPASTALACGVGSLTAVVLLSIAGGWRTLAVAVTAAAAIVSYGYVLKARGVAGNLVRGLLGALTLLYGAALGGSLGGWPLVLLTVAFWAHDASSNLVGTLRDIDGDRAGGYRTVPVRFGIRTAFTVALALYTIAMVTALAAGLAAGPGPRQFTYLAGLVLTGLAGLAAFAVIGRGTPGLTPAAALRAHEILVLERVWFAATVVALGLGVVPACVVALPLLAVTWWTQGVMRSAYEFGTPTPAPVHR
jgi:geranylgeranylglycerol-phosphate geranylgeranyltransferase